MNQSAADAIARIGTNGFVTAQDVMVMRRNVFADGVVSPSELDALFALGERAPEGDKEWEHFFAEAAADFYLREEEPHGYLTDEEFQTLKARVTRDGLRASGLELGLLIKLLETARTTPAAMSAFVGAEIKRLVSERKGAPRLTNKDAGLVRRWLFAAGGDGNVAVTRAEAELLFDLNDLCAGAENDAAWTDLFCKAVANHLMAHIGYKTIDRTEALRTQAFMSDRSVNVGRVFSKMFSGNIAKEFTRDLDKPQSAQRARNAEREKGVADSETVTQSEADWLAERITRDGEVRDCEKALVKHLKSLAAELPPKLKEVVGRAA